MNKVGKKIVVLGIILCLVFSIVGCSNTDTETGESGEEATSSEDTKSVALVLAGPINDMGWNASAYEGLMNIQEDYGVETSYSESVAQSDAEEVIRNFGVLGYDVIFIHGSEFQDATLVVAEDFPDSHFVIINGMETNGINVTDVQVSDEQQGFLMGAFASLMSETRTVGVLGGMEIPPIVNAVKGFEAGAKYVDPDITVLSSLTGSFDDVNAAKETAYAFIDNGADFVGAIANQASLGSIEAAEARGVYAVGAGEDQAEIAPDTIVVSVMKKIPVAFEYAYGSYLDGTLEAKAYKLGVKEGVIFLSSYHDFEDKVPEEVKARMIEIADKVAAGEVTILD